MNKVMNPSAKKIKTMSASTSIMMPEISRRNLKITLPVYALKTSCLINNDIVDIMILLIKQVTAVKRLFKSVTTIGKWYNVCIT